VTHVLIAEDEPATSSVIAEGLADRLSVSTQVVANGALVVDALRDHSPELMILDIALPGLCGLDVFDLTRNDPRCAQIPVLFLTAAPERAMSVLARAGVHRTLAKPFDLDELVGIVRELLGPAAAATAVAA